jgi:hypothetical protein
MVGKFKGFDGRLEMPPGGCGENGEEKKAEVRSKR